jgi:LPXTG-motif cell wall-anchored protein
LRFASRAGGDTGGMNNTIWLIVGVLAIIALLIFIAPHFQ